MLTRTFLRSAVAAAVAAGAALSLASAAQAQEKRIRWQMASGYPSSMVQLGTLDVTLRKKLALVSGGNTELRFNEPGARVPALQLCDAVSNGSVDAG